jgi:hypothetical protein
MITYAIFTPHNGHLYSTGRLNGEEPQRFMTGENIKTLVKNKLICLKTASQAKAVCLTYHWNPLSAYKCQIKEVRTKSEEVKYQVSLLKKVA